MNILFVCTGNTCRSPMAEGLMKELAKRRHGDIHINSAGIYTLDGLPPSSNSIEAMNELNIDIQNYRSNMINETLIKKADLILTMTINHKKIICDKYNFAENKIYTLNEYIGKSPSVDITDPYGQTIEEYRNCCVLLKEIIEEILIKIV